MKRAFLAPLALLLVVSLPLAEAHPVCQAVEDATQLACAPTWGPLQPTCDAAADAVTHAGQRAEAACEDVL